MSIENTVPPEQHQKEQLLHSEKAGETKDSSDATNDTNVYDTTLGRKIRSRRRPARQVSEKKFEESNGSEAAGIESTCVPSHPYRHRDHNKETEEESLVSSSFSHDNGFGCDDINEKSGTSMINVKVETGSSKSNTRGGDLRELWEQAQQVTTDDLKSTANRRFLHSVVYRHRMGIQFSALRSQIERDIMQDPIKALQKPERALYVDLIIPK